MPFGLPKFYRDPNGSFKIDERNLRPSSSSSRSSSSRSSPSHQPAIVRVTPSLASLTTSHAHVPVVEVISPLRLPTEFRTELRTPRPNPARPQHLVVTPHRPKRNSPSPSRTSITTPAPRPSFPPSPASARFDTDPLVPPEAPEPPSAVRGTPRDAHQTESRVPRTSYTPIDLKSDPGAHRSASSQGRSRKAHSDRGHGRKHSTSTASTEDSSSSSRQSDARTAPTSVSGQSNRSPKAALLEEAPQPLPRNPRRVRIAEEQIEYANAEGRQRINRYRYA